MHWLSILALGIAANLDNLGVGLAYGVKRIQISLGCNAFIAGLTGVVTLLCGLGGRTLLLVLPAGAGNWLGGLVIVGVGGWMLAGYHREAARKRQPLAWPADPAEPGEPTEPAELAGGLAALGALLEQPERADVDRSGTLSLREAFVLGLALAVNAGAGGLGGALTGISVVAVTVSVTVFSLLTIGLGRYAGDHWAARYLGKYSGLVAGLLLVAIGIYEILL